MPDLRRRRNVFLVRRGKYETAFLLSPSEGHTRGVSVRQGQGRTQKPLMYIGHKGLEQQI